MTNSIENRNPAGRGKPTLGPRWFLQGGGAPQAQLVRRPRRRFQPAMAELRPALRRPPQSDRTADITDSIRGLMCSSTAAPRSDSPTSAKDIRSANSTCPIHRTAPSSKGSTKPDSGWTLCHTGRMIFAFRSLKPATLANDPKTKGSITDWYDYKKTAWILEAVEAPESAKAKTPADDHRGAGEIPPNPADRENRIHPPRRHRQGIPHPHLHLARLRKNSETRRRGLSDSRRRRGSSHHPIPAAGHLSRRQDRPAHPSGKGHAPLARRIRKTGPLPPFPTSR